MTKNDIEKQFYKSRKFLVLVILLGLCIFEVMMVRCLYYYKLVNFPWIETAYYVSQIASSLFVSGGVIVAVWQYYLSRKSTKIDLELSQVQRAIDLSEYYKDNILIYLPAIKYVFDQSGATKILDTIHTESMQRFDKAELERLLTPNQIKGLQQLQKSSDFLKAVLEANDIYNLKMNIRGEEEEQIVAGKKKRVLKIDSTSVSIAFMSNLINRVLNNMEYFALHFRHFTADETVVYQSLHQTYIKFMPYFYYYIARANENSTDKLYTNVIWLYGSWKSKSISKNEEHAENADSLIDVGTTVSRYQHN